MGTSKSSGGSPSNVPIVPPWVPDVEDPDAEQPDQQPDQDKKDDESEEIAQPGRFRTTRLSLGKFAESGDGGALKKGVGRYVATGMGGSGNASKRLSGTASTARSLYTALSTDTAESTLDRELLEGKSGRQIINAVIELACPHDGSMDAEAGRDAINDALSVLLERYPDANLLQLTDEQREYAIIQYVAHDVYRHFALDVGLTIQEKAPSASTGQRRLKEAREFIRETVVAEFQKQKDQGKRLDRSSIVRTVKTVLRCSCEVFQEWAE